MNRYLVPFSISIIDKFFFYRFIDTGGINDSPTRRSQHFPGSIPEIPAFPSYISFMLWSMLQGLTSNSLMTSSMKSVELFLYDTAALIASRNN